MPISALVITLGQTSSDREAALEALAREPELELGEPTGLRIPAVSETATLEAGRLLVERLLGTEGVLHVDVLSINFEDS
jgi:hypothetical protein